MLVVVFCRFFKDHPKYQDMFKPFKGKSLKKLKKSKKLKAHGLAVMQAITNLVDTLDDPQTLVALVQKLARSHMDRKATYTHFEVWCHIYHIY